MIFNEIILRNPEMIDYDDPSWVDGLFRILEEGYIYLQVAPEDFVFIKVPLGDDYA